MNTWWEQVRTFFFLLYSQLCIYEVRMVTQTPWLNGQKVRDILKDLCYLSFTFSLRKGIDVVATKSVSSLVISLITIRIAIVTIQRWFIIYRHCTRYFIYLIIYPTHLYKVFESSFNKRGSKIRVNPCPHSHRQYLTQQECKLQSALFQRQPSFCYKILALIIYQFNIISSKHATQFKIQYNQVIMLTTVTVILIEYVIYVIMILHLNINLCF